MSEELVVFEDREALARSAANFIAESAHTAVANESRFTLVLAGGSTPRRAYEVLAGDASVPWERVHLFIGDERFVDPDDPESNLRTIRQALLDRIVIPPENLHFIDTLLPSPASAAQAYERTLREFFGGTPSFDLTMLGMGADGHTASLFPGNPEPPPGALVVAAEAPASYPTRPRVSLTLEVLNESNTVLFLVAGKDKVGPLAVARSEKREELPAGRVIPRKRLLWYADRAAAGVD